MSAAEKLSPIENQPELDEVRHLLDIVKQAGKADQLPQDGPATIRQVAAYFQVTEKTIREWQREKPSFPKPANFGKSLRWDAKKVRSYWAKVS
jgi:hypothetical protein